MKISDHIPQRLKAEYERTLEHCKIKYPFFNIDDPIHQMFAVQILLLEEVDNLNNKVFTFYGSKRW